MTLSKVGGAGSAAMRSISARCSCIAASSAGPKCSTFTWSKGGTPPCGPPQRESRGFAMALSWAFIGKSRLGFLVAGLVLRVGGIEAGQRRALLHLAHDPALEALLLRRPRHDVVDERRRNEDRAVVVDHDPIAGEDRDAAAADGLA